MPVAAPSRHPHRHLAVPGQPRARRTGRGRAGLARFAAERGPKVVESARDTEPGAADRRGAGFHVGCAARTPISRTPSLAAFRPANSTRLSSGRERLSPPAT